MKNKLKLLDRSECLTLLCTLSSNYWSRINFILNIPLVLTSSSMCIINSISTDANDIKIPNIIVNAFSVLIISLINNIKASEKYDKFKRTSQQFLELAQEIDAIEGDEVEVEKYNILTLKYDNLIKNVDFEDINSSIKNRVSNLFINNDRNVPIQVNGISGNFKRNSKDNKDIYPMSEIV